MRAGPGDAGTAYELMTDSAGRLRNRAQLTYLDDEEYEQLVAERLAKQKRLAGNSQQ